MSKKDARSNWTDSETYSKWFILRYNYFTLKGETAVYDIYLQTRISEFSFKSLTTHATEEEFENEEKILFH